jgi:hypothetical protein
MFKGTTCARMSVAIWFGPNNAHELTVLHFQRHVLLILTCHLPCQDLDPFKDSTLPCFLFLVLTPQLILLNSCWMWARTAKTPLIMCVEKHGGKFVTGNGNSPSRIPIILLGYCGGSNDGLALSCIYIVFQKNILHRYRRNHLTS